MPDSNPFNIYQSAKYFANKAIPDFGKYIKETQTSSNGTNVDTKSPEVGSKIDTDVIFGLPPREYLGDDETADYVMAKMLQSMIVIELHPASPEYTGISGDTNLNIFRVNTTTGEKNYKEMFLGTGIEPKSTPIKIAVLNDVSVSESWSTDFGESRFEDVANVGGTLIQELKFITGNDTLSGVTNSLGSGLASVGASALGEELGSHIQSLSDTFSGGLNNLESSIGSGGGVKEGLLRLASGSKIDFPLIWRGSSFSPSYSFTVRLYNPNPKDEKSYIKNILTPLTHILAFMCPKSDSDFTFTFPVLCKAKCPGLFGLDAAFISSVDVVKGGESNDISFTQRPGTIDVRFTLNALYSTMIAKTSETTIEDRPTLSGYVNNLRGYTDIPIIGGNPNRSVDGSISIINDGPVGIDHVPHISINKIFDNDAIASVNRLTLENLEAFGDPVLRNILDDVNVLADINIQSVNNYVTDLKDTFLNRGLDYLKDSISLEDRLALKIKNKIPIKAELENWFWNHIDTFGDETKSLIENIISPTIKPIVINSVGPIAGVGGFTDIRTDNQTNSITQTGSF